MLMSITALLEIYRRAQWNFLRVELEHIRLLKTFAPINGFDLPYKINFDVINNSNDIAFVQELVHNNINMKRNTRDLLSNRDGQNLFYQVEAYKTFYETNDVMKNQLITKEDNEVIYFERIKGKF